MFNVSKYGVRECILVFGFMGVGKSICLSDCIVKVGM